MDKEFYDLVYDAWRSGRNPDLVSEDRYDYHRAQGYYPDEITLGMVYPQRSRSEEEEYQEYMREQEEYYRQQEEQEEGEV